MSALPESFIATALDAADSARGITARYFRTALAVDSKQDSSPVTVADRETEEAMRQLILQRHPEHGFFGEEGGNQTSGQRWRWIIDPIDGTKSFATGKPTFGTLIALLDGETPVLGVIDHVMLNERWIGIQGKRTTLNGNPCESSNKSRLDQCSIYTTTLDMFDEHSFARYDRLSKSCQFRAFGGDCYSYGLLAAGHTELICEADLKPYDYMALVPVVEGAGGIISDWQGRPLTLDSGDKVLACANPSVHQLALDVLARD